MIKILRKHWYMEEVKFEVYYATRDRAWEKKRKLPVWVMYAREIWQYFVIGSIKVVWYRNCKHPNMIDDSYGGPESGAMGGECPDCGFCYEHILY